MDDFYSDVRARKALTYGARHKKNGSKSKKCSLPSDGMTKKQWKERCGKVVSFSFDSPIIWSDFKNLGKETQTKYINNLMHKYGISCAEIAEMMGVCAGTVRRHIKENGLDVHLHRGGGVSKVNRERWEKFINGGATPENAKDDSEDQPERNEVEPTECVTESVTVPAVESRSSKSAERATWKPSRAMMRRFSIDFDGELRIEEIANSLLSVLGDSARGMLHIEFDVETESSAIGFAQ